MAPSKTARKTLKAGLTLEELQGGAAHFLFCG